jgi:hypothetical protein
MAQDEEQKKEDDATKHSHPNPVAKPLPPREATDDELDGVVGGLSGVGDPGGEGGCLV